MLNITFLLCSLFVGLRQESAPVAKVKYKIPYVCFQPIKKKIYATCLLGRNFGCTLSYFHDWRKCGCLWIALAACYTIVMASKPLMLVLCGVHCTLCTKIRIPPTYYTTTIIYRISWRGSIYVFCFYFGNLMRKNMLLLCLFCKPRLSLEKTH